MCVCILYLRSMPIHPSIGLSMDIGLELFLSLSHSLMARDRPDSWTTMVSAFAGGGGGHNIMHCSFKGHRQGFKKRANSSIQRARALSQFDSLFPLKYTFTARAVLTTHPHHSVLYHCHDTHHEHSVRNVLCVRSVKCFILNFCPLCIMQGIRDPSSNWSIDDSVC